MNILDVIVEKRKVDIAKKKERFSIESVKMEAIKQAGEEFEKTKGYEFAFKKRLAEDGLKIICEVKRASPSKGIIVENFSYLDIAKEYEQANAAAISVLTEPEYFMGKDEYLREIAKEVSIPVLRKDFVVDVYQIYEAKLWGAKAVLLISTILGEEQLGEFLQITHELGMSALVETHNKEEIESALRAGAEIIGVNNRDLKSFQVDIQNCIRLRKLVPEHVIFVAESGISTEEEIALCRRNKVDAVLIGECLMKSQNRVELLNTFLK